MKKILSFVLLSFITIWFNSLYAQCTPDASCTDTLNPGEICPEILPDGTVGVPYYQVVTIIPPGTADIGGNNVTIHHIELTGVDNMPPGLTYVANDVNMYPPTKYCVLISGTPTTAGTYNLGVRVVPYIDVFGNPVATPEQTDDTSLVIVINNAVGINSINNNEFSLIGNIPNPIMENTKIGFFNNRNESVELKVFNVLGEEVYSEKIRSLVGENYFRFSGVKLHKGIYIYSVTNGHKVYTKQLIKNI